MKKGKEGNRKRKGFSRDDKGVSSVLGVVLLISIVVVITSVIAAFVFGAVTGNKQSPCAELVVKNAVEDELYITIVHYGGDGICLGPTIDDITNIEIKHEGQICSNDNITLSNNADPYFNLGEELNVTTKKLEKDDSICILYTPADSILQRVRVVSR